MTDPTQKLKNDTHFVEIKQIFTIKKHFFISHEHAE